MGIFSKTSQLSKKYDVDKAVLGSGNFATVKKCTKKDTKEEYAVKIIDKSKVEDMQDIDREIEIMGKVDHQNVIKLYEVFDEPKKMNLVLEYVTGGELFDRIVALGNYTEVDAAKTIYTLCDALHVLHSMGIVHRDLKPENILLKSSDPDSPIKIADFGLARMMKKGDVMKTACGTPGYVAPEVLQNKGYDSGAIDVWSAGCILYVLLCGFPPFYSDDIAALFASVLNGDYEFPSPWWDDISDDAKDCVSQMLTVNPEKRMKAADLPNHPWITSVQSSTKEALVLPMVGESLKKYQSQRSVKGSGLLDAGATHFSI